MNTKVEKVRERLRAIMLLRNAKKHKTYKELAEETDLPSPSLSRYVKGHVLPSYQRARTLIELFEDEHSLHNELKRRIDFSEEYFDIYPGLFDIHLLRRIARYGREVLGDQKVDRVISTAIDGIPLAVLTAEQLDVPYSYSKRSKEVGIEEFYEQTYHGSAGVLKTIYLPKKYINRGEQVVLIDDILRTGSTLKALIKLVKKAKANINSIFTIVSFKKGIHKISKFDVPIFTIIKL